jgi:fatty acid desaturase
MDSVRILAQPRRASEEITAGIETEIDELHVLDARKRTREFAFFFLLYAVGAFVAAQSQLGLPAVLCGILIMGVALNSCGIFIHDGLHGLLAKNPRNNHALSFLVGLPILMSPTAYEITHQNHHYALGRKLDYGTYRQHARSPAFVWAAYLLQLLFGSILYVLMIPFLAFRSAAPHEKRTILLEYLLLFALYSLAITNIPIEMLVRFWVLPLVVMMALTNVRGLASHALGDVEDIYLSSRTVRSSRLVAFLFLHENYHLEHHIFPRVPSYNLAAAHVLIWNRLPYAVYAPSYVSFLANFFKAARKRDLRPLGVVTPRNCA